MQIHNSNWNYNKMGVNEMGMVIVIVMEMQRLMMENDALASNDPCNSKDDALCKFPLQIPSRGEISASCGVSECRISDPSSRGETI